jgi:hypothetical protein
MCFIHPNYRGLRLYDDCIRKELCEQLNLKPCFAGRILNYSMHKHFSTLQKKLYHKKRERIAYLFFFSVE